MKKTLRMKFMLLLFTLIIGLGNAWAQTTTTVTASKITSSSESWTGSQGESWSVSVNGGATNQNVTNSYAQVGTRQSPSSSITFSTSGITGTITSIVVDCAAYSGYATISATVDNSAFGSQNQDVPSWSSNSGGEVSFTNNNGASGAIEIIMTNGNNGRAMYIKSIVVTYTTGGGSTYTVTYNCNGGTSGCPTENPSGLSSGDHITLADAPTKTGHTFNGWNDGTTTYAAGDDYTVTGSVTMTAQWTVNTHTINLPAANTYGTYGMGSLTNPVAYGTTVNLTYTPASGYENYAATWSVDDEPISGNSFTMPDEDVTVTVSVAEITESNFIFNTDAGLQALGITKPSSGNGTNLDANHDYTIGQVTMNVTHGSTNTRVWNSSGKTDLRVYASGGSLTFSVSSPYIAITAIDFDAGFNDWSGSEQSVTFTASSTTTIKTVKVTYNVSTVATPTFTPVGGTYVGTQSVVLNCITSGASIYYTTDGSTPDNTSTPYTGAISVSENMTIKAIAYANDEASNVGNAVYTITQPLTTIPAIFNEATSTAATQYVIFNNWVVTGVSSSNVFVTDRNGNGFVINGSDLNNSYTVGKQLSSSGNALECTLTLTNGYAQLTNVDASELTQTDGEAVAYSNIAMADLSGVNTGALVRYENLTCDVRTSGQYANYYLVLDDNNEIQIYGSLYAFGSLTDDKTYTISGVYQQYNTSNNTKKEILPRNADDIVLKADLDSDTDFSVLTPFTYIYEHGPSEAQTVDIYCYDLEENTLTATAPANFEVSLTGDDNDYSSSVEMTPDDGDVSAILYIRLAAGEETGDYGGNLVFTAANLDTKNVALTGTVTTNPTYVITLMQPAQATISDNDVELAEAGTIITLSYTDLDDCYNFTGWSVYKTGEPGTTVTVENNQFSMPGYAVTATATFTQKTFAISYSVNGTVEDLLAESVNCGNNAPLHSASDLEEIVTLPSGYILAGWSTSAGSTATVDSFIPDDDATLYAVLVPAGTGYQLITSASQITSGTYLIGAFGSTTAPDPLVYRLATGGINNGDMTVQATGTSATNGLIGPKPNGACEFVLSGNSTDGYTITKGDDYLGSSEASNRKLAWGSYSSYHWKFADKKFNDDIEGGVYMHCTVSTTTYKVSDNGTSDNDVIRSYTSNTVGRGFYLFKKIEATPYTRVFTGNTNASANITIEGPTVITSGSVLNMGGHSLSNGTAANLIIEDGGQLVTTSPVKATIYKTINAWNTTDKGWYLISSPIETPTITSVTNLITTDANIATYDLLRYNEQNSTWETYHNHMNDQTDPFNTFETGRGYLYRNAATQTLEFAGTVNTSASYALSYANSNTNVKGFNIIGNPYPHVIYMNGEGTAIHNTSLSAGYYRLGLNGGWSYQTTQPINPGEGILVQVQAENVTLNIENTDAATKANHDNIRFEVSNSQYEDATCAMFDKGYGLNKIDHRNPEIPMIYIPQNGQNYAIAMMDDNTEAFDLNFKAMTMGKYTLRFKTQGEFNYLHVIDRMTGEDIDMLLEGEYSFVGSPQDNDARFIVRLGYLPNYNDNGENIFAYQSGSDVVVSGEGELQIFDVTGRMVMNTVVNGVETISTMPQGVYIFRMIGSEIKTQKIVVR